VNMIEKWTKDQAAKRWQQRLEDTVKDTGELFVLKSTFNPLWNEFDVKNLLLTIKEAWVENCPRIEKCNLVGRCSLHNSSTMQHTIPFDIRVAEKKRLDASTFKYTLVNPQILADTQIPVSSSSEPQQYPLERFWNKPPSSVAGSSRKRQNSDDGVQVRLDKVKRSATSSDVATSREVILSSVANSGIDDSDIVDVSVSCLSTNPSLPRHEEPEGPYSWAVGWTYSEKLGIIFEKKPYFDFFKTTFFNRRMLVSHKRTNNLFDLASAWRKARNRLASSPDETAFDDWN